MLKISELLAEIFKPENIIDFAATLMGVVLKRAVQDPEQRTLILDAADRMVADTAKLLKETREQFGYLVQ